MTMTVKKSADTISKTVFVSNLGKVADAPNGASIKASELVNGSVLPDGSAVTAPSSGLSSVVKSAKALTGSTGTAIKVDAKTNQFKVGEKIFALLNGKHYAITEIAVADGVATITVGTAIDAPLTNGGFIYQNEDVADGATGAALIGAPVAITGTNKPVDTTTNMHMDVWAIAAVKRGEIGAVMLDALVANRAYIAEI